MLTEQIEISLKKKGILKNQFLSDLGLSKNALSTWKNRGNIPSADIIARISDYLGVPMETLLDRNIQSCVVRPGVIKIPVYRKIVAGYPAEADDDIIDWEELSVSSENHEYIAIKVDGDSMRPELRPGDTVIIRCQPDVDSGRIAAVLVNGNCATLKKVIKHPGGITLMPLNSDYEPITYTDEQILSLPVTIVGQLVESRHKFD